MASPTPWKLTRFARSAWPASTICLAIVSLASPARADKSSTSIEQGYDLGWIETPRALAMGGAQTATGASSSALFENPANMPLTRVYHFEALGALIPEARRQTYGGAVVDSMTNRIAGGLGGTWNEMDPDGIHRVWTDLRLALAYPLGDRFSIGVTGRYLRVSQSIASGPFGQSLVSDGTPGAPIFNNFTFDAGATVIPFDGLHIGVVGHNLTVPGTSLAPTTLIGGVGYQSSSGLFSIEGDGMADFTTWTKTKARLMIGGEFFLGGHFPLRAGYRYDDGLKTHALSLGVGYVASRWSVEIAGRRDIAGDLPVTFFLASLRYFYESGSTPADEPDPVGM